MRTLIPEAEARALYAAGDAAHDFDHVLRVTRLAVQIALAENADATVVRLAALLHDLPPDAAGEPSAAPATEPAAQSKRQPVDEEFHDARIDHHLAAAARAARLLEARQAPPELVAAVVHAIQAHRFRDRSLMPQTLEARCLYDADKLDAMGAIGVLRAAAFAAIHGNRLWHTPARDIAAEVQAGIPHPVGKEYTPVHEFVYKLHRLYGTLFTDTGRALGRSRHATMLAFFTELDEEMAPLHARAADGI